ncbi:MAG: DUF4249 domain-containing protein [Siphonobacter sp.]
MYWLFQTLFIPTPDQIFIILMKASVFLFAIFALLGLASCVKDSTDITLESDPKLVVECYLNPSDSVIVATVSSSRALTGEGSGDRSNVSALTTATVTLSDGSKTVTLTNASSSNSYKIAATAFPILSGHTYTLSVAASGLPTASASCTIPASLTALQTQGTTITSELTSNSVYTFYAQKTLSWDTPENSSTNYFLVGSGYGSTCKRLVNEQLTTVVDLSETQVVAFLSDGNTSSHTYTTAQLSLPIGQGCSNELSSMKAEGKVYAFAYKVDYNYYEFFRTVKLQRESGDNPFAEAASVYTNIQNGLGVFAAYTTIATPL